MLPIALLPIAGLLLGVGASFTNEATLEAYNLLKIMGPGTVPYTIFSLLASVGTVIFDNLPLLFAMGVALGMAENEKATATLSAAIAFFVMQLGQCPKERSPTLLVLSPCKWAYLVGLLSVSVWRGCTIDSIKSNCQPLFPSLAARDLCPLFPRLRISL